MRRGGFRGLLGGAKRTLQSTAGMTLLVLLTARQPLQAQSISGGIIESAKLDASAELFRRYDHPASEIDSLDAWARSGGGAGRADGPVILVTNVSRSEESSRVAGAGCARTDLGAGLFYAQLSVPQSVGPQPVTKTGSDAPENSKAASVQTSRISKPYSNRNVYYRNSLEFSFETGWHPVNIPFVYDFAVGGGYNVTPLKYTLVPTIASLRLHVNDVGGPWIFRGNFDFTFSGSVTLIPRGPETHYFAFIFGIRRNFVRPNWRIVPYFDQRGGAGFINAKEPLGVLFSQGQNLTFTYNIGAGVRYHFDSRYSISAGVNYMHISNGYLSEPKFINYGINVYGPMVGMDIHLGKPRRDASQ